MFLLLFQAGEGLANYGDITLIDIFDKLKNYPVSEISDTCTLGYEKIKSYESLKE